MLGRKNFLRCNKKKTIQESDKIITNNLAMLKVIGIWPGKGYNLCGKIKFILMILVSISVIVPETVFGLAKPDGFTSKTQTVGSILAVIGFTIKYIILFKNRNDFRQLVEKLQEACECILKLITAIIN